VGRFSLQDEKNQTTVEIGDDINFESVLCCIKVLKLKNYIDLESLDKKKLVFEKGPNGNLNSKSLFVGKKYKIKNILVKESDAVEYGTHLFIIEACE